MYQRDSISLFTIGVGNESVSNSRSPLLFFTNSPLSVYLIFIEFNIIYGTFPSLRVHDSIVDLLFCRDSTTVNSTLDFLSFFGILSNSHPHSDTHPPRRS